MCFFKGDFLKQKEWAVPETLRRQVLTDGDKEFIRQVIRPELLNNGKFQKEVGRLHRLLEQEHRRRVSYLAVSKFCQGAFS